jgi:hypothetical protein
VSDYIILYFVFICLATVGVFFIDKKQPIFFYFVIGIILILIAGFRGEGVDRDYENYSLLYKGFDTLTLLLTEPTFVFISWLIKSSNDNVVGLFIIYAFLGVTLKFFAIRLLSYQSTLSVLIYFSTFFLLHEMTQIRAGVASGIFLLSIQPLFDRKLAYFFALAVLAILFHYSSFIILPLYFLSPSNIKVKLWGAAILAVYFLHFCNIHFTSLLEFLPLQNVQYKLEANKEVMAINEDKINVFNILQIMRLIFCFLFLSFIDLIQKANKYSILLLKIYILSVCSMVAFADVPTFSVRISEFFGVVELIIIPFLVYIVLPKRAGAIAVVIVALILITTNLFYTKLLSFV